MKRVAVLAASVLLLSACGESSHDSTSASSKAAGNIFASDSATQTSQAANLPATPLGTPFTDGGTRITLSKVTCTYDKIANGTLADDGSSKDYVASPGNTLCVITGTITNVGSAPLGDPPLFGSLTVSDGKEYAATQDDLYAAQTAPGAPGNADSDGRVIPGVMMPYMNPGTTKPLVSVYQIPKSASPASVEYQNKAQEPIGRLSLTPNKK